ncbi:MAG TPA: F0F1 ATP synthase subunit B [Thermomicrobiales bacterium]|jgi:F-type H+-transporting ATPase subunit b|nr:F0F1 ATP synthase subunit B [Thermomicrobiales bacterium]
MGQLGINGWNLIIQAIAFIIFLLLFWRFALGPIVRMIDERRVRIQDSMEAAQKMQVELKEASTRNEEILRQARQEGQQILAQARETGEATIARAQEQAGKQADEYLARAEATLRNEVEQARQQLRQEVADLAVTAAGKIVRKELDPKTQARLIEETLAEASNGRTASGAGPAA